MKTLLTILLCLMQASSPNFFNFSLTTIDGEPAPLQQFHGKVVLIVNVASMCGYTPHYKQLQELHQRFGKQGLVVIGVPCNDFGAQEPGTNAEIKEFCSSQYGVTFPMMSKVVVKGKDKHPLYAWLTSGDGNEKFAGDIPWNFEKFLIGKNGHILARFNYKTKPDDPAVISAIQSALQ